MAGFFSFTEVTDPAAHPAYNEWHQLDHMPEQMPLEGIVHGERWVISPGCRRRLLRVDDDFAHAHYLTLYLMTGPVETALHSFYERAEELHRENRFFPHRRAIAAGPLRLRRTWVSPRLSVTAAALPHRPNRGAYVAVHSPTRASDSPVHVLEERVGDLLSVTGVAGVSSFEPFRHVPSSLDRAGDRAADRAADRVGEDAHRPTGANRRFEADVLVCYLDEDPAAVSNDIGSILASVYQLAGITPNFAGPLEAIVPWKWDWFEQG